MRFQHTSDSKTLPRGLLSPALVVLLLLACSDASAQFGLQVSAGAEYTENPRRTTVGEDEDEVLTELQAQASFARQTQRFITMLDYSASKLDYKNDFLSDRTYVSGNSSFTWLASPDFLSWNLSNSRSLQVVDSYFPDTMDNRELINITSTGPTITLRPGAANRVNLRLDYSLVDYEESPIPQQKRKSAYLSLAHSYSPNLTGMINATGTQADFGSFDFLAFENYSLSLAHTYAAESYSLAFEIGQNQVKREFQGSQENMLLRASASYQLNSRSGISLSYSESAEDLLSNLRNVPGNGFGGQFPGGFPGQTPGQIPGQIPGQNPGQGGDPGAAPGLGETSQAQVYQMTQRSVSYNYNSPDRFSASLGYSDVERAYEQSANSQMDESIRASLTVPVRPDFGITLFASVSELDFAGEDQRQERREVGLSARYQLNTKFNLSMSVSAADQESDSGLWDYDGVEGAITFTYQFF